MRGVGVKLLFTICTATSSPAETLTVCEVSWLVTTWLVVVVVVTLVDSDVAEPR